MRNLPLTFDYSAYGQKLRISPSKQLGFLLATIFRTFNSGVDGKTSKDELLHGKERPLGMATLSSSLFFVPRSVEDGTLCWGGDLIAVSGWGQQVGVGIFLVYLTRVTASGNFVGQRHEFCHSFD